MLFCNTYINFQTYNKVLVGILKTFSSELRSAEISQNGSSDFLAKYYPRVSYPNSRFYKENNNIKKIIISTQKHFADSRN